MTNNNLKEEKLEEWMNQVWNHESFKTANNALILQHIRQGTDGYHGEELNVVLEKILTEAYQEGRTKTLLEVKEKMTEQVSSKFNENIEFYKGRQEVLQILKEME